MSAHTWLTTNALFACSAYFVGTASPGPSNLAIMSTATAHGRKAALAFALGVLSGSLCWALLAMLGWSAALLACSRLIVAIKLFGGLYLLWLAFKSGRSALAAKPAVTLVGPRPRAPRELYLSGAMLHLTNPKAILVWLSVAALASPARSGQPGTGVVMACCLAIGLFVFGSYAMLFSMPIVRRGYVRVRRGLEGCLAVVFGLAGFRLLVSRTG
ncbi:lysine transporter LysE [Burkholderia sp. WAC0059]|uniref:LysE family translocator n=1 Tax=Burkholderia sp. WAC0059 TaxID=2066022 RepID=UPI000C7EE342|nr:LysE family translocator [Burkholderia sp. WAC0059]PLZ02911.1 lysine transporter LysE [Burkholderia sp. WAC0059]